MRFDDDGDLPEWLSDFLEVSRYGKGIVHRVLEAVGEPGEAYAYRHRFTEREESHKERAIVNALR